jgi:hypothetical protein
MVRICVLAAATVALATGIMAGAPQALLAQVEVPEVKPEPGRYEAQIEALAIDIPGAPSQMSGIMKRAMSRTVKYCLTPEEVEEGFRAMTERSNANADEGECTTDRYSFVDGRFEAALTCRADGRSMKIDMTGTGTATSADIVSTMSGDMGMGPGEIQLRVRHKRLGEC